MRQLPRFISVDDHVVEPTNLFLDALPTRFRSRAPRVERRFGRLVYKESRLQGFDSDASHPESRWGDYWLYDDLVWPLTAGFAAVGETRNLQALAPVTYDEIDPGCYDQSERLKAMDANHTDASMCFPTMPRFCGQHFLERDDKDFALLCLRAYNDWMLEDWCGGAGRGRLIPVILVPLWDVNLAVGEVRRCAGLGAKAISFSECPPHLGLPSIHSGYWDPLFAACEDTDVVVNMHIGTSSRTPSTAGDAPTMVTVAMVFQNSQSAAVDWLASGVLARFPRLRIALSEGQIGWLPFVVDRLDSVWKRSELYESDMHERVPKLPSEYVLGRIYGCIFDDVVGLRNRASIGMSQIMFEVDYPHADSTFPNTLSVAEGLVADAGLNADEEYALFRGNAITCYRLGG